MPNSPVVDPALEQRFERMVHHMRDGLLMLDSAGNAVAINRSARVILKLSPTEDHVPATAMNRLLGFDPLETVRAAGRPLRMEFWVGGIPFQAELAACGGGDSGDDENGCVLAFRDVREEKRLDQMKSELINVASHELRTPLTAINNALNLLRGNRLGETTEQQRHFVELASRNVFHLMEMIGELLDSAKLESGTAQIERELVDLERVILATEEALSLQAEPKALTLTTTVDPALPNIYGKASMLERVLINLIGNAIKFTPEGGTIEVHARSKLDGNGRSVEVSVTDTGPGIPPDELESVFDRFHQVGRAHGREVAGTGLGLAIARELVQAHHGRIWADNAGGGGARFVFAIPILSENEFFLGQLERDLDRSRKVPMPLTLVVVRFADAATVRERAGKKRFGTILEALTARAEATAYRSSDRIQVLSERAEITATLLDTSRPGGLAFARRLADSLNAELQLPDAELVTACATFPEEAVTAERLYRLATIPDENTEV